LARSGRFEEAVALSEEAARLAAGTDYLDLHAHALVGQAEVFRLDDRTSEAASALEQALELLRRKGNVVEEARAVAMLEDLGAAGSTA
jgi:tetratricopeptide (TPR) repeat protein